MKKEYENYLIEEYGNSRIAPVKISICQHDFIIPYTYANPMNNYTEFENALFDKYLKNQTEEIRKYHENGYRSVPTLRFTNTIIIKPYRMRDLDSAEAKLKIADEIYKRYNKAIHLAMNLNRAYPDKPIAVKVDCDSINNMNATYNKYLDEKFPDKALKASAKAESLSHKIGESANKYLGKFTTPMFKAMNQKYANNVARIKRLWMKNRQKIAASFGAASIAAVLTMGAYKPAEKNTDKKQNITEASVYPKEMIRCVTTVLKNCTAFPQKTAFKQTAQKTGFDALDKNVQEFLANKGLGKDQLNDVQKHNLNVFMETQKDFKLFVAFAENFYPATIDDNKGFLTLGYGCTNYLNEKGEPLEKRGAGGKISAFVQAGQSVTKEQGMEQVDRVAYFHMLPKVLDAVKVKLDKTKMVVTKGFAYVANKQFESSKFVQALNENKSNQYLGQCMAIWNVDGGIPKRFFMLNLMLNNHLKPEDIIKLKPVSCYNLTLDQCLLCKTNRDGTTKMKKITVVTTEIKRGRKVKVKRYQLRPDYVMKNGMPQFNTNQQFIKTALENMTAGENEKSVADIVPKSFDMPYFFNEKQQNQYYLASTVQKNKNVRGS